MNSGTDDDYTSYIEDAEKNYYIWKNREIILKIYELVIAYEEDFDRIIAKRNKLEDLIEENNHLKNKLHIEDNNELLDFENLLLEQKDTLNSEKEVLENIVNYTSRIKFKEERLEELEEINNSYEILTILREYGIIDTYDTEEEAEEIPEEVSEEIPEEDRAIVEQVRSYGYLGNAKKSANSLGKAVGKAVTVTEIQQANEFLNTITQDKEKREEQE